MVLRLSSQIVIDRLVPVFLHQFPILNHSSSDHIVRLMSLDILKSLIADVIIIIVVIQLRNSMIALISVKLSKITFAGRSEITVGIIKEGSMFPEYPILVYPVPLSMMIAGKSIFNIN